MAKVGQSQHKTERTTQDKFAGTESLAHGSRTIPSTIPGRISPQLSCTILPEDKQLLNELTLHCSIKGGKVLNTSTIIRALIRLGTKYRDELEY